MSGGIDSYIDALNNRKFRAVAMSVFASGAIPPDEAIEWVTSLPNIESIVFGASSRANIESTAELVKQRWQAKKPSDHNSNDCGGGNNNSGGTTGTQATPS